MKTTLFSLAAMAFMAPEGDGGSSTSVELSGQPAPSRGLQASLDAEAGSTETLSVLNGVLLGLTGKVAYVHKKDSEGLLAIDAFTGQVIPSGTVLNGQTYNEDRPEWSDMEGGQTLVMAMLAERTVYYAARLGADYANNPEHKNPELFAFEDLAWLGLDSETGEEATLDADAEHRMEVIAAYSGIDRSEDLEDGHFGQTLAEVELSYDNTRTGEEMRNFTEAQDRGFAPAHQKTGTEG